MVQATRALVITTAAVAVLAFGGIGWRLMRPSSPDAQEAAAPGTSASGVVTRGERIRVGADSAAPSAPIHTPTPTPAPTGGAASTTTAEASAKSSSGRVTPAKPAGPRAAGPATAPAAIKHPVQPRASQPPLLPTEADDAVAKLLGKRAMQRYFYLQPLARRFVASVDNLGRQPAPTDLWLLRPAKGELALSKAQGGEPQLAARSNGRRYEGFVRWVMGTDNARLLALYARLYPLLQQSYVELGHPDGYFNDRLIEVIDQLLATPKPKAPLRVQPARPDPNRSTPPKPRVEFSDAGLESLSTGQKILLRIGPQNAAQLKTKLKALRAGLLSLAPPEKR